MNTFLAALGSKLAERWLTLLIMPGALYLTTVTVAVSLGHRRWYDLSLLRDDLNRIAAEPALTSPGAIVVGLAGLLAGAAGLALAVQALAWVVERLWLLEPRGALARHLTSRRLVRWDQAQQEFEHALAEAGHAQITGAPDAGELVQKAERLNAARNRIALTAPRRPFWLGDRLASVDYRIHEKYQLDLASAWPRLWLIAPAATRAELGTARTALSTASRLIAWAITYLALGAIWWPAVVIGTVAGAIGW